MSTKRILSKVLLQRVGTIGIGDARVEARAEHGHDARLLVLVIERPLLLVFEMRLVRVLVIGGVDVGHLRRQARFHDGKVLVGQGEVDHDLGRQFFDEVDHLPCLVGVDDMGGDIDAGALLDRRLDGIRLSDGAARQMDRLENIRVHRTFVRRHAPDAARADNEHRAFSHEIISLGYRFDEQEQSGNLITKNGACVTSIGPHD